jgi:hypothetical protein
MRRRPAMQLEIKTDPSDSEARAKAQKERLRNLSKLKKDAEAAKKEAEAAKKETEAEVEPSELTAAATAGDADCADGDAEENYLPDLVTSGDSDDEKKELVGTPDLVTSSDSDDADIAEAEGPAAAAADRVPYTARRRGTAADHAATGAGPSGTARIFEMHAPRDPAGIAPEDPPGSPDSGFYDISDFLPSPRPAPPGNEDSEGEDMD